MDAPHGEFKAKRLPALDFLRFVAAASVLLFHFSFRGSADGKYTTATFPEIDPVTRYGSLGVALFFIISGFVILLTVDAGQGSPARFFASRVSRLYPVFWVACTITFILMLGHAQPYGVGWYDYLLNLGMLPSLLDASYVDGVYWTLEVELRFYLLIGLYLLFLQKRFGIETFLWLWLVAAVAFGVLNLGGERLRVWGVADHAGLFVAGCVFYRVYRLGWSSGRGALLLAACALSFWMGTRGVDAFAEQYRQPIRAGIVVAVLAANFTIVGILATWPALFALGGRLGITLGSLTYPLYLLHQKIGYLLINAVTPMAGRWLALGLAAAVALGLAWGLHRWVERPWNPYLRNWLERRFRGTGVLGEAMGTDRS